MFIVWGSQVKSRPQQEGRQMPPGCGGPSRTGSFIPSVEAAGAWEHGSAPLANQKQGMEPYLLPALWGG